MSSQSNSDERKFTLIKFIPEEGQENGKIFIEIVPTTWINFDAQRHQLITQFMPAPYTSKRLKVLNEIVKTCKQPISDWPSYDIEIRGHATETRCRKLSVEAYGFTTDTNENPKEIADRIQKMHRVKRLATVTEEDANALLKVLSLNESFGDSDEESNSSINSKSSEDNSAGQKFSDQHSEIKTAGLGLSHKINLSKLEHLNRNSNSNIKFYSMPSDRQEETSENGSKNMTQINTSSNTEKNSRNNKSAASKLDNIQHSAKSNSSSHDTEIFGGETEKLISSRKTSIGKKN